MGLARRRGARRRAAAITLAAITLAAITLAGAAVGRAQATGGSPRPAAAPGPSAPTVPRLVGPRHVDGRVIRSTAQAALPVADVWVTLHRVGPDRQAPMDSTRTDASGHYRFTYTPFGSDDAIYFVSSTYAGIAYFSQPLKGLTVSGPDAEVTVFDTTSHAVPMTVRGRHLIVSAPGSDGTRDVVEVFEISNDTSVTVVAPGAAGDRPTWSAPLPTGAERFRAGQGDVPADAIAQVGERAEVFAPFAPGVKQLSYSYSMPRSAFPLAIRSERAASVLEVVIEEPLATVTATGLSETNPVAIDGRTFRRFLGQDVPAGATIRIGVPGLPTDVRSIYLAIVVTVVGAAMTLALARAFSRRAPAISAPIRGQALVLPDDGERLARQIVELDDAFGRREARAAGPPTAAERAAYVARRDALKARLGAALAESRPAARTVSAGSGAS
jgi:hypothetical protein